EGTVAGGFRGRLQSTGRPMILGPEEVAPRIAKWRNLARQLYESGVGPAYELTAAEGGKGDPQLLDAALRWADVIERSLPPQTGRRWRRELEAAMPDLRRTGGSYAEDYGRTISFFLHVYHATGHQRYLRLAQQVAREAIDKLYVNGLFRGHPAKPYYEGTNGVGILLHALLELHLLPQRWQNAF
ncbi:hypothetical protein ACFL09_01725, partial [Planctomycetota bacterium]